jgi:16S rRNA (adenine1518-N6/adenine1519-N6)-dimethyltransferase
MNKPRKSLGQHWLTNEQTLGYIAECAILRREDTVLEIGPGLGNLTNHLLERGAHIIAVEKDESLAKNLKNLLNKHNAGKAKLEVITDDILDFDLTRLPRGYKVVANIPYYLTGQLLKQLCSSANPPSLAVLLVQKEVAVRLCAKTGNMSIMAVSVQLFYECSLGGVVPADQFEPIPEVDSQVVVLTRRPKELFPGLDTEQYLRLVKAGFSERRKKLRSSLSGGLRIAKTEADTLLKKAGIDGDQRAQELSLVDWHMIYQAHLLNP